MYEHRMKVGRSRVEGCSADMLTADAGENEDKGGRGGVCEVSVLVVFSSPFARVVYVMADRVRRGRYHSNWVMQGMKSDQEKHQ